MNKRPLKARTLTIASPCGEDWSTMKPVDWNKRHCDSCKKDVVDFSLLTEKEANRTLKVSKDPCIRLRVKVRDGKPVYQREPQTFMSKTMQSLGSAAALALAACQTETAPVANDPVHQVESTVGSESTTNQTTTTDNTNTNNTHNPHGHQNNNNTPETETLEATEMVAGGLG